MEHQKCRLCGKRHPLGPCPVEAFVRGAAATVLPRGVSQQTHAANVEKVAEFVAGPSGRALAMRLLRVARYSEAELAAEIGRLRDRLELLEAERKRRARSAC